MIFYLEASTEYCVISAVAASRLAHPKGIGTANMMAWGEPWRRNLPNKRMEVKMGVPITVRLVMTMFYSLCFFVVVILVNMAWHVIRKKK